MEVSKLPMTHLKNNLKQMYEMMLRRLMKLCGRVPWTYYIIVSMAHWKYLKGEKEEEKERRKEKQTKTGGDGEAKENALNASKTRTPEVSEDPLPSSEPEH